MASKKMKPETLPAVAPRSGALAPWEQELSADAEDAAAMFKAAGGSPYIVVANGHFVYNQEIVDDVMRNILVLGVALDHAYYAEQFDRENPMPPTCWALEELAPKKDAEALISPPADVPERQAESCKECWANKWASGARSVSSRGKACKNSYRLVIAAIPDDNPDALKQEDSVIDLARIRISPTSMKWWAGYARGMSRRFNGRLPWGYLTQFNLEPVPNAIHSLIKPAFKRLIEKDEAPRVATLRQAAADELMQPYDTTNYEERKKVQRGGGQRPTQRATAPPPAAARAASGASGGAFGNTKGSGHGKKAKY